jgi:hypothetical protein
MTKSLRGHKSAAAITAKTPSESRLVHMPSDFTAAEAEISTTQPNA